jgi:hypothetical protein
MAMFKSFSFSDIQNSFQKNGAIERCGLLHLSTKISKCISCKDDDEKQSRVKNTDVPTLRPDLYWSSP